MFLYRQYQLQFNTACCQQPCAMRASDSRTHSRTHTHVCICPDIHVFITQLHRQSFPRILLCSLRYYSYVQ